MHAQANRSSPLTEGSSGFFRLNGLFYDFIKAFGSFGVFLIGVNVRKHRITGVCTGKTVEIDLAGLVLTVLIQREECDIV